jgi:peptidyl-tRNA hydrolase, PTH1 family
MRLLVGLGNPGTKYEKTRHNVGFLVVDAIASKSNGAWETENKFNSSLFTVNGSLLLAKPQTFMNSSGEAVKKIVNFYKIDPHDIYVIHDDLDITLGNYKIQLGKGPELHYGVKSIEEELGTKNFWRVRIGIDNRNPENRIHGETYTLQNFTDDEEKELVRVINEVQKREVTLLD